MSSHGVYLLYCFTSGVAYYAFFREHQMTLGYWLGLVGLGLFNVVLGYALKVQ